MDIYNIDIYEARRLKINPNDILSYNMSDEEKLVYYFENNKEKIRCKDIIVYYLLLGISDKYKTPTMEQQEDI